MTDFTWDLPSFFRPPPDGSAVSAPEFALIILNQPLRQTSPLQALWKRASARVAADGGANRLLALSRAVQQDEHSQRYDDLDLIIGDLDSLEDSTREYYTALPKPTRIIHDEDQYSTDFGKAVEWVRSNQESHRADIVALGGLGGRVDQGLSQIHHLYLFQQGPGYELGRMLLLSGQGLTFLLKPGKHGIRVKRGGGGGGGGDHGDEDDNLFGKHVGIIPMSGPSFITTKGLEWDVENWETRFGGQMSTSNHVLPETQVVEVETTNEVLFTIALAGTG